MDSEAFWLYRTGFGFWDRSCLENPNSSSLVNFMQHDLQKANYVIFDVLIIILVCLVLTLRVVLLCKCDSDFTMGPTFGVLISLFSIAACQFQVPDALVEVFHPRGLKVSIPDQDGIKLFAFHGYINKEFEGREAGQFSRDIVKAKDGRWTFNEPTAQLKIGDVLYFWTYVDYFDGERKLGYPRDDQKFEVKALIEKPGTVTTSTTTKPPTSGENSGECFPTITTVNDKPSCAGKLIFNELFNSLRPNFWKPEVRMAGGPDYEFVLYENRPETISVSNGSLLIRPVPTDDLYGANFVLNGHLDLGERCTAVVGSDDCVQTPDAFLVLPPVVSAMVTTKERFAFTYGRVEIKAKLPKGDWIYPELFLTPKSETYGPGYESGQIRIAFLSGNKDSSNTLQGGIMLGGSPLARSYGIRTTIKDGSWGGQFHKYWVKWTNESIAVGVDNFVYGTITPPPGGFASEQDNLRLDYADRWRTGRFMAPFDKKMYLTIGVGVGGHNFKDSATSSKPWKNDDPKGQKNFYKAQWQWKPTWGSKSALEVDYVKVWSL